MFPRRDRDHLCLHKDVFVNKLRVRTADPGVKIRQIHYVGHGGGGGLYFGYHNAVSAAERTALADMLSRIPPLLVSDSAKRRAALTFDAALMSGFFRDALEPPKLAEIKKQLAPDTLMHVWGCFAGAPTHTFHTTDPYWNLFNAEGSSIEGVARHIARTLGIEVTACRDPEGIHGMDLCFRDAKGAMNCSDVRPERLSNWLWPESRAVRCITWNAVGVGDEKTINFLGNRIAAAKVPPGRPPKWFTKRDPARCGESEAAPVPRLLRRPDRNLATPLPVPRQSRQPR